MNKAIRVILIAFLIFSTQNSFSCGGAFQRKLFPIGERNDTLLFREISMSRLPQGDSFSFHTRLLFFNKELNLVKEITTDSIGYDLDSFYKYESFYLEKLIYQGLILKNSITPYKYAYGDYLDSTSFAEVNWELDSLVNRVMFKFKGEKWREIKFYPIDEKPMFENYPRPKNCPENLLTRGPHLGSLRIYKVGSKKLAIVHLCNSDQLGDPEMDWEHKEITIRKWEDKTDNKTDKMASHSYGTDVVMWVE